jgi:hypothetical protein
MHRMWLSSYLIFFLIKPDSILLQSVGQAGRTWATQDGWPRTVNQQLFVSPNAGGEES